MFYTRKYKLRFPKWYRMPSQSGIDSRKWIRTKFPKGGNYVMVFPQWNDSADGRYRVALDESGKIVALHSIINL